MNQKHIHCMFLRNAFDTSVVRVARKEPLSPITTATNRTQNGGWASQKEPGSGVPLRSTPGFLGKSRSQKNTVTSWEKKIHQNTHSLGDSVDINTTEETRRKKTVCNQLCLTSLPPKKIGKKKTHCRPTKKLRLLEQGKTEGRQRGEKRIPQNTHSVGRC